MVEPSGNSENRPTAEEIPHDLYCQDCGYNLRALTSNRCPECGQSLDSVRLTEPQIPWVHRAELGRFTAYWKTLWQVAFRMRRFCDEMARPVSYRDAQRFRWVTILHVCVPLVILSCLLRIHPVHEWFIGTLEQTPGLRDQIRWVAGSLWPMLAFDLLVLIFLAVATGIPSYFFHPRGVQTELQNRAIALSYYACGPLALTPVLALVSWLVLLLLQRGGLNLADMIAIWLVVPVFFTAAWWGVDLRHLAKRLMPQRRGRAVLLATCVPLLWFVSVVTVFGGIPFVIFYIFLIVDNII